MEKKLWGKTKDNEDIYVYDLTNGNGMTATCMNYGAILLTLLVPDSKGNTADVVLGYEHLKDYFDNNPNYGCCVGRHANRIGNARFTLNGVTYELDKNDGKNNLHSGFHPLHKRIWEVSFRNDDGSYETDVTKAKGNTITFTYLSPDMDQGFPGNLEFRMTYTLCEDNSIRMDYYGISDQDTVFNPTNHSYFNLSGHDSGDILSHELTVYADSFTYADEESIPDGTIRKVAGTPMDFRKPKAVGRDIHEDYDQLIWAKGYDHNYIINPDNDETMTQAATLHDPASGRTMEVYTTLPGMHVYCGNYMTDEIGKGGYHYQMRGGICFETQYYPNALNVPSFVQPIIKAGVPGESSTIYKFH